MRQKGFTLVELLVTLAVGSVLLMGAVLSIQQVLITTGRSNSQVVVMDELNRAALYIKKDLQSRDSANISGDSNALALDWIDNTAFESENETGAHSSSYIISDTGELQRNYDDTVSIIARQIESINFSENGAYIDVVITATSSTFPPRSETLSFSISKRREETQ